MLLLPYLPFDQDFLTFLAVVSFFFLVVVHIACFNAIGAWLREHGSETVLLEGGMWRLIGLGMGLFGLLAFWAMHLSSLRGEQAE